MPDHPVDSPVDIQRKVTAEVLPRSVRAFGRGEDDESGLVDIAQAFDKHPRMYRGRAARERR